MKKNVFAHLLKIVFTLILLLSLKVLYDIIVLPLYIIHDNGFNIPDHLILLLFVRAILAIAIVTIHVAIFHANAIVNNYLKSDLFSTNSIQHLSKVKKCSYVLLLLALLDSVIIFAWEFSYLLQPEIMDIMSAIFIVMFILLVIGAITTIISIVEEQFQRIHEMQKLDDLSI